MQNKIEFEAKPTSIQRLFDHGITTFETFFVGGHSKVECDLKLTLSELSYLHLFPGTDEFPLYNKYVVTIGLLPKQHSAEELLTFASKNVKNGFKSMAMSQISQALQKLAE